MEAGGGYRNRDPSGLAKLAAKQHGVVSLRQLKRQGYSRFAVARKVAAAELHPIHRGVYAVGHTRLTIKAHFMAAVLACGPDAVLSHHAAAALWDLRPNPQGPIDVTAPGKRTHRGVRCHVSTVPPEQCTIIDAIPVTTLSRTVLDYAETSSERQLRAALQAGQRRRILDARKLQAVMAASPGRRGSKPLRRALAELEDDPPWLQSKLERDFHELLRSGHVPLPRTNVLVDGELVDCVWPPEMLIVEVDSYGYHRGRRQFEDDRRRDAKLQTAGWRVIRVTEDRMSRGAAALLTEIRQLLAR
jgi:very-short-patch-repair endonuclease